MSHDNDDGRRSDMNPSSELLLVGFMNAQA
jgi:hypothetical protein